MNKNLLTILGIVVGLGAGYFVYSEKLLDNFMGGGVQSESQNNDALSTQTPVSQPIVKSEVVAQEPAAGEIEKNYLSDHGITIEELNDIGSFSQIGNEFDEVTYKVLDRINNWREGGEFDRKLWKSYLNHRKLWVRMSALEYGMENKILSDEESLTYSKEISTNFYPPQIHRFLKRVAFRNPELHEKMFSFLYSESRSIKEESEEDNEDLLLPEDTDDSSTDDNV